MSSDWGLECIVKGQSKVSNIMEIPMTSYDDWLQEYYLNQDNATLFLNEMHQIYTPCIDNMSNGISSSESFDNTMVAVVDDKLEEFVIDEPKEKIVEDVSYVKNSSLAPKRRKNKHKKISVQQATADRISSDKWNWRKYGEKVIKGSPYPRSYYRCSNTGGCSARKQVEVSCSDPGKFLITYIEDHTHPYPSRRPSQAGRTSRRFHHDSSTKVSATSSPIESSNDDDLLVDWDGFFNGLEAVAELDFGIENNGINVRYC